MTYTATFADIDNVKYRIDIINHNGTETTTEIELGDEPCVITTQSDSLFSTVKSRSCTVNIVTSTLLPLLYATSPHGVSLQVTQLNVNGTDGNVVFFGYVTPCAYSQGYADYLEELTVEAVDAISTLQHYDYTLVGDSPALVTFKNVILRLCSIAGVTGNVYFPNSYNRINSNVNGDVFKIGISESNFFDDDEDHTPWKCNTVLEEICRYMGWSCVPYGNDIYLIDYRLVNAQDYGYYAFNVNGTQTSTGELETIYHITEHTNEDNLSNPVFYAGSDNSISYDDLYNKFEISANTYEVEDVLEVADGTADDVICVPVNGYDVVTTSMSKRTTKGWWFWKTTTTSEEYNEYRLIYQMKDKDHWTHHFYKHSDFTEITSPSMTNVPCYDSSSTSKFRSDDVNHYCNTLGALYQRYACKETGYNPTSLDWKWFLTFFALDDTSFPITLDGLLNISNYPVLEYYNDENIIYSPYTGQSFIVIQGDLWYQMNHTDSDDSSKTLSIISDSDRTNGYAPTNNEGTMYATAPVEDVTDADAFKFFSLSYGDFNTERDGYLSDGTTENPLWGTGWEALKCKLQIGDKYWNGSAWTTTESTFTINYSNNPTSRSDEEHFYALEWLSPVNNTNYTSKVNSNGWCIPINPSDKVAGTMKFTMYCPYVVPPSTITALKTDLSISGSTTVNTTFGDIGPVINMKDFDLNYVYVGTSPWWINNTDEKEDILYTNEVNSGYINNTLEVELKINSCYEDKPISRSYAYDTDNNNYVYTMKHKLGDASQVQENNLIDMYNAHYSSPKLIYECEVKDYLPPYVKVNVSAISGDYVIDTQSWDIKHKKNKMKIIQY